MNASITDWVLITVCFITYFIVSMVYKRLGVHNLHKALFTINGLRFLNLKHMLGIVLFGVLTFILIPEWHYLITVIKIPKLYLLLLFIVTVLVSSYLAYINVKKQYKLQQESECIDYGFSHAWFYFSTRFVFLLSYEFFFRGVLLFKLLQVVSLPMAIFYNTVLYVIIHSFDSKKEILGSIPFGIVLCLFAYYTDSIWYAFLIHLALSAVYEIYLFYHLTLKNNIIS